MFNSILVLCIGNICRSPVAEGLLKHFSQQYQLGLNVSSAGVHAMVGQKAQPHSIQVANEHGIDITSHVAKQLTSSLVNDYELILVADETVRKIAISQYPHAMGKIKKIGHFRQQDIDDPYQKPKQHFDTMYIDIDLCLRDWLEKIWNIKTSRSN